MPAPSHLFKTDMKLPTAFPLAGMPVHRFANYPNTRVYTNAFIVIHDGVPWCIPMVEQLMDGGEGETLEFGKGVFQTTDWTRPDIVFRTVGALIPSLYVDIPGGPSISFQRCKQRNVHILHRLYQ